MPPTQQYPVTSGTASFYPGTSPAEYPPYGEFSPQQTKAQQTSTRFLHIPSPTVDGADLVGRRVCFDTVCGKCGVHVVWIHSALACFLSICSLT